MWGCDCCLFGQSLVCHFLENSTPAFLHFDSIFDFAHQRSTLDTSFGGALRFGGVAFPVHGTSQPTLNLKPTKTRLERIRSHLEPPRSSKRLWTARVSSAIDDMAGNNACTEVFFEATFRLPRADPHELGPWKNLSVKCTFFANRSVAAVSFWCAETAVRKRCSGVPSRA